MGDIINKSFFRDIRNILQQARQKAYVAVNFAMVGAYWQIGKRIIEEEQAGKHRADYRSFLITRLSKELTIEFGKGFSVANLKNFRQFYLTFPDFEKGYTVCSQLSWSHYRLIMRVESQKARNYYLTEACEQHWSTRQLQRNINSYYYERLLGSADKKTVSINNKAVAGEFINKDDTAVKYSVLKDSEQLFASKYQLVLPTEQELIAELEREIGLYLEGSYE